MSLKILCSKGTFVVFEIVAVSVGGPQIIGDQAGKPKWSAIRKIPVAGREILLTPTGLAGDQQVETGPKPDGVGQVHGGHEKALYVYPAEHYPGWMRELGRALAPGGMGENLTIRGVTENDVHIGDRWRWGEAIVEVRNPRQPCNKLCMHLGANAIAMMRASGHCGWYMSVIDPGVVPTGGMIDVIERHPENPTVAEVFARKLRAAI